MNDARRKKLQEAVTKIDDAKGIIEEIRDEEQDSFDNMPESMQNGDKGSRAQEIIDYLEEAAGACETAIGEVSNACE